jgi:hypothetical protein
MDRRMILDHLQEAERHVADGARLFERQRAIIEERRRDGHDVKRAETLLQTMQELQRMHIDHLDTLRKELAEAG